MARCVFLEDWWLEAATGGARGAVSVERDGKLEGWLPYGLSRNMGFSYCGVPSLTRLLFPVLDVSASKGETLNRLRFQVESDLISRLPKVSSYEFVLPPDHGNALAWQAQGFDARMQHTFVIDPGVSDADQWLACNRKTRNLIRRAAEGLQTQPLTADAFEAAYGSNLGSAITKSHLANVRRIVSAAIARGQGRAVGAVDASGRVHAAVTFVWDHQDFYYYLSTRDVGHSVPGAVGMLVWSGIKDAAARGLRFDFDGVSSRNRLRFLQSFGGRLTSRIVVSRGSPAFEARMLVRRIRRQFAAGSPVERFY